MDVSFLVTYITTVKAAHCIKWITLLRAAIRQALTTSSECCLAKKSTHIICLFGWIHDKSLFEQWKEVMNNVPRVHQCNFTVEWTLTPFACYEHSLTVHPRLLGTSHYRAAINRLFSGSLMPSLWRQDNYLHATSSMDARPAGVEEVAL